MADRIRGITVEIGGDTSGLSKALKDVNGEIKDTNGQLKDVERLLKLDPKNTELLAQKQKLLTDRVSECKTKLDTLKKAQETMDKNGVDKNSAQYMALQREIVSTEQDAKSAKAELKSMSKVDLSKLKKGAQVAGKAIAAVGAAALAAATAIGKMTIDAAYNADDINTLAKKYHLSTDEIQKFMYASEMVDVPIETVCGSFSKLTKTMVSASSGSGAAYDAFQALGVEVTNQDGTLRDSHEVWAECIAALGNIEDETTRDAYAMAIFGKSAADLNPLIEGGMDALEGFAAQAEAAGIILSQDDLNTLNLLSDAFDTFKATLKGAGMLFSVQFAEPMADALNLATGYMESITSAFKENGVEGAVQAIGDCLNDLCMRLTDKMPEILQLGMDLVMNLVTGLLQNLPQIAQTAISMVATLVSGIGEQLPTLIPMAIEAILTIVSGLLDNIGMLVDAAITLVTGLVDGIMAAIPILIEKAPEIVQKLVDAIVENAPKLLESAGELIMKLVEGIITNFPALIESAGKIIVTIVNGIKEGIGGFLEVGKNMVEGIWEGISNGFAWIKGKITEWVGDVLGFFKKLLRIGSPSKVMADNVGRFMAQGIGLGFEEEMARVNKQMTDSLGTVVPDMALTVAREDQTSAVLAGNGTQALLPAAGNTINIYTQELTAAQVDYLFARFNHRLGVMA